MIIQGGLCIIFTLKTQSNSYFRLKVPSSELNSLNKLLCPYIKMAFILGHLEHKRLTHSHINMRTELRSDSDGPMSMTKHLNCEFPQNLCSNYRFGWQVRTGHLALRLPISLFAEFLSLAEHWAILG